MIGDVIILYFLNSIIYPWAIWADWAVGAEGVMGSEGAIGAEEDEGAAIYLMFDG